MEFYLLPEEAETLLHWWENACKRSSRFGGATYIFPTEDYLVSKLKRYRSDAGFDDMDLEIFIDWMEKSLKPHPGQQEFYFPGEASLVERLRRLKQFYKERSRSSVSPERRAQAVRLADDLLRLKNRQKSEKNN